MRSGFRVVLVLWALATGCSPTGHDTPDANSATSTAAFDAADRPNGNPEDAGDSSAACVVHSQATLSEMIGTVGIVTLTTEQALDAGYIEYGPDRTYGMQAPLSLHAADYRTLLLGMREATAYHYRVVARSGEKTCTSSDAVLTTGSAPAHIPRAMLTSHAAADAAAPGFVITSTFTGSSNLGQDEPGYVVIYDAGGALVWWYELFIGSITRARLAWDAQSMYARDGNPSGNPGGKLVRVSLDGLNERALTVDRGHHDLAVTPDNGVLLLTGQGRDGCDRVQKLSADDDLSLVYDLRDAFDDTFEPRPDACHCNSIHYNPADDSITVSCLLVGAYIKLTSDGKLVWVVGNNPEQSHFSGDIEWNAQHGHHMVSPERLLFFNNGGLKDSEGAIGFGRSLAVELQLDLERMRANRVWTYDGGQSSQTLGDAQRLVNGNTLITYSNAGVLHEINTNGTLVKEWRLDYPVGYARHRSTLYGPPDAL